MVSTEFLITSLIVVLIPGTGVIYTISTGLFLGGRSSLFAALGCTAGIVPHLLTCVFGLAAILHMSSVVFQFVKLMGVVYLAYLAWSMWKQSGSVALKSGDSKTGARAICLKGFLINILNPKLSLFFLAFLPQFVPPQAAAPLFNMLVLSGVFMLMTLIIFIIYGLLADKVSRYIINSTQAQRIVQRSFAALFALLAAKLAFTQR